jgi:hypothetical protein
MYGAIGAIVAQVLIGIGVAVALVGGVYREKIKDVFNKFRNRK